MSTRGTEDAIGMQNYVGNKRVSKIERNFLMTLKFIRKSADVD